MSMIVIVIKIITAREIFTWCPHVKKLLWGGYSGLPSALHGQWLKTEMKILLKNTIRIKVRISTNSPGSPSSTVRCLDPWVEVIHYVLIFIY